ncbi:FecR domain-containing protein [Arenibacter sp. BSSL-BM3]|uniref:FecR domain-containing protein n=1 Tax=Arenibacter arenosicollis TaxID=2762274 RepID=A0ABR7QTQ1_9FLAO|nr:FecR family protein [Arenibacter arenosicollis]MBC8770572.1 FecR domain-containing protein [Arenibacter arenosicollis]
MIGSEQEKLILKYLSNNATAKELDILSDWILDKDNAKLFQEYTQLHLEIITSMNGPDTDKIKEKLLQKIKRDKIRKKFNTVIKYAAVGLLIFSLGYYFQQEVKFSNEKNALIPKEEAITIILGNGKMETLRVDENREVMDDEGNVIGTQNNTQLSYTSTAENQKLIYNRLNVPYGKKFDVVLSDGTHVHLNSGSSLRYPVAFIQGASRKVFLTGEAYFDVAEDEKRPFLVNANEIDIQVLGTKFNVSNYPEDANINTVLVEGSVELLRSSKGITGLESVILKPGHKAEWHKNSNEVSLSNVDTSLYTAWIKGKLVFRNTSFRQIREGLQRHYNVVIHNKNVQLEEQIYDATFDIETIDQVLESFNRSWAIDYIIIDNEVFIE